jgi:hypothetical protein
VGVAAEQMGERAADQQSEDWHPAFEDAKDECYLKAELGVYPRKADPDRRREVVETDRDRDEQDREHKVTVVGVSISPGWGPPRACGISATTRHGSTTRRMQ